ncbi:MAG: ParA family protein [Myxococcota bacterium]
MTTTRRKQHRAGPSGKAALASLLRLLRLTEEQADAREPLEMIIIVLASLKGGVGKSLVAILLVEWCNHMGIPVDIIDTDPGQTLRTWAGDCEGESRSVVREGARLVVVDTAGNSGGCLPWLRKAAIVVCPFRPNFADLSRTATWFVGLPTKLRRKFLFLPNAVGVSQEHKSGIQSIAALVRQQKQGRVLTECTLRNRDFVYPGVSKGLPRNFFALGSRFKDAQREADLMAGTIMKELGERGKHGARQSH